MELLIIKTGPDYIRVAADEFIPVGLDKASVFPPDRLGHVRELEKKIRAKGFQKVSVKKLVLTEEDLP